MVMKPGTIPILIILITGLMMFGLGTEIAYGSSPASSSMGPGSGAGPDDGQDPGPRWKQETANERVETGILFRYGMDTPSSTIESERTGGDIGLHIAGIGFSNQTTMMSIRVDEEEWTIEQGAIEGGLEISYKSQCEWYDDEGKTGELSMITVLFRYQGSDDERVLGYNITVEDPPENGSLTYSLTADTRDINGDCCWNEETQPSMHRKRLTLRSDKGNDLTTLDLGQPGSVETVDGIVNAETEVVVDTFSSTASLNISQSIPLGSRSASISGSMVLLEELVKNLKEGIGDAVEFVVEHIYYFIGGAALTALVLIISISVVSVKKVETQGSDLDLNRNRYYRERQ